MRASNPIPERILLFGGPGVGKSYAALTIPLWSAKTGDDAQVYIIDTDAAMPRMLTGLQLPNTHVYPVYDWPDYTRALDAILQLARPHDWLAVDLVCTAWEAVQAYYTEQIFGTDPAQYFLDTRRQMQNHRGAISGLDGWRDWGVINKMYGQWINRLTFKSTCNLLCTAKIEKVGENDAPDTQRLFGPHGVKPRGQKHLAHAFHTVIWLQQGRDNWTATTVKDRGRELWSGFVLTDFTRNYLCGPAGWKLK